MRRLLVFMAEVAALTVLMFGTWALSAAVLPAGVLRPFFARLFAARVGELSPWSVLAANLVPFAGVAFMNLFRAGKLPGGLYVLPVFWVIYGLLLGTNSFVFAAEPAPFSVAVLWQRTGFTELLAYTASYEATRGWALWEQEGLWRTHQSAGKLWQPEWQDAVYGGAGLVLLVAAAVREAGA